MIPNAALIRALLALAACALLGAPAAAAPVYKCKDGGRISYSDRPCPRGPSIELAPPPGVRPEGAESVPTRDARTLLEIEKLRIAREQRAERARAQQAKKEGQLEQKARREHERARRLADARHKQCARLKLRHKWAAEDAARLPHGAKREAALLKARRQAETLAVQCPA